MKKLAIVKLIFISIIVGILSGILIETLHNIIYLFLGSKGFIHCRYGQNR